MKINAVVGWPYENYEASACAEWGGENKYGSCLKCGWKKEAHPGSPQIFAPLRPCPKVDTEDFRFQRKWRAMLMAHLPIALEYADRQKRRKSKGMVSLFEE